MLETKKAVRTASCMMLLWMAFYLFSALVLSAYIEIFSAAGCVFPLLAFRGRYRPHGVRGGRARRYDLRQYALFFGAFVSGCALLSFFGALAARFFGASEAAGNVGESAPVGGSFLYLLVFACVFPALFEEALLRCGVLGALSPLGGTGVLLCGVLFGLMHLRFDRLLYAVFAGILLSALVFLTENVYIGMLLHFVNNFCALLLSYVHGFTVSCVFAAGFAALFLFFLCALRGKPILKDMRTLFAEPCGKEVFALLPPSFWLFVFISMAVSAVILFV